MHTRPLTKSIAVLSICLLLVHTTLADVGRCCQSAVSDHPHAAEGSSAEAPTCCQAKTSTRTKLTCDDESNHDSQLMLCGTEDCRKCACCQAPPVAPPADSNSSAGRNVTDERTLPATWSLTAAAASRVSPVSAHVLPTQGSVERLAELCVWRI